MTKKKSLKPSQGLYPDTPTGVVYVEVFPATGGKWAWERIDEEGRLERDGMGFPDADSARKAAEAENPDIAILVVRA